MEKRLQVYLNDDEWYSLDKLKEKLGIRNNSDIIRVLIKQGVEKNENE